LLDQLKKQVCGGNLDLVSRGLVIETWGNLSGIDRSRGLVVIKPSGVPYSKMRPADMVVVALEDGRVVEGDLRPSSDTPTHLELYRAFEGVGAIVHTHSLYATAWAQAKRPIPCFGTTHADTFHGSVPCTRRLRAAEIRKDYERNTGKVIVETFARLARGGGRRNGDCTHPGGMGTVPGSVAQGQNGYSPPSSKRGRGTVPSRREAGTVPVFLHVPGVLVAEHGPFAWGKDVAGAVSHAVILEAVAHLASETLRVDPSARPIGRALLDKHFLRKHGAGATYGQR